MAILKAIFDKLDDIPEAFRDLYKEKNGKFEVTEIEGIKTEADVTRLSGALTKERNDHKSLREKFSVFGDRTPEQILADLDRLPELEAAAAGKLDETKINELVEKRIGTKVGPLQRQVQQLSTGIQERDTIIGDFKGKERTRTIHDAVREAIGKSQGFQPGAVEDALIFAERMLDISEDGKVIAKDNVGVTPGIDPVVWLSEMQNKKSHWWGPSSGGGANGNRGNGMDNSQNPFTHEHWNMTQQGAILKTNPTRAAQLALSAGTTIGGKRPAPRK